MKITAIEAVPLAIPLKPMDPPSPWTGGTRKQIVVRVHTDEGWIGLGEAFAYGTLLAEGHDVRLAGQDSDSKFLHIEPFNHGINDGNDKRGSRHVNTDPISKYRSGYDVHC